MYGEFVDHYGQELMREQLREELIFRKHPEEWWKYIELFDEQCVERGRIGECSVEMMNWLGIDGVSIAA
jgi:hypothetical protein